MLLTVPQRTLDSIVSSSVTRVPVLEKQQKVETSFTNYWRTHFAFNPPHLSLAPASQNGDSLLQTSVSELHSMKALPEDWDSYGGRATTDIAVSVTEKLLRSLVQLAGDNTIPYHMAPLPDGGVYLEWRAKGIDGKVIVYIGHDGEIGYLNVARIKGQRISEERENVSRWMIVDLVSNLLSAMVVRRADASIEQHFTLREERRLSIPAYIKEVAPGEGRYYYGSRILQEDEAGFQLIR